MGTRQSPSPYHNIPHPPFGPAPTPTPTSHHHPPYPPHATYAHGSHSPVYAPHNRPPSDAPPYLSPAATNPRSYSSEPQGPAHHSRALSSSSLPSGRELGRAMPPPNSPPQQGQPGVSHHQQHPMAQQPPPQAHGMGGFGAGPPPPRTPLVALGPPSSFPSRELPVPGPASRAGSTGSSMSISSLLGGPPPVPREPPPPAGQQQHYSPHSAGPPGSAPNFTPSVHASPRMHSATTEFVPFRRPQTPDHHRPYDPRANPVQSPRGPGPYSTPEVQRYGTPQAYHNRQPSAPGDPSRDPRMPPTAAPPPRPSSQPKAFPGMRSRPMDSREPGSEERYVRRDELGRPVAGPEYNPERTGLRPYSYDERYQSDRERQGEMEQREQQHRERAFSGGDIGRQHMHPHEQPRNQPPQQQYGRPPPDSREARDPHWGRQPPESSYRAPMEHQRQHPEYPHYPQQQQQQGPPYQGPPHPDRYPPTSHPAPQRPHSTAPIPPYDSPERSRAAMLPPQPHHEQQQPQHVQRGKPVDNQPPPGPAPPVSYNNTPGTSHFDASRHRPNEDPGAIGHQRNLLNVLHENRKGRVSPLPQAVQGAQPQQPGHAAEPGIKSEFGRMFSGIGSGVGGLGVSSPIASSAVPFTTASLAKREDNVEAPEPADAPGKGPKGRRRKLKEEDSRDDDSSDRLTPSKAKRAKGHPHHHHHHHHHHHRLGEELIPGTPPFKNLKGGTNSALTPGDKIPVPAHHHHHHHHGPRPAQPAQNMPAKPASNPVPAIPPRIKTTISSQAVLDAVAKYPRHHLGDFIYEAGLKSGRLVPKNPAHRGFSSNPKPLPLEIIKGKLNCVLTVKVPRIHLSPLAREEITSRGYLWGTDVYTDDSDVVAACIHGGWIKGEWSEEVDVHMLDLDSVAEKKRKGKEEVVNDPTDLDSENLISTPPASGPMRVPEDRDLHVNVLILPRLSKYAATTRHGISSREFGGEFGARQSIHDGLSYKVLGLRWVENGAQPQARLRGRARRERMRKAMAEVKGTFGNTNGFDKEQEKRLMSEVSGNWWKNNSNNGEERHVEEDIKDRRVSDGDKENLAEDDNESSEKPKEPSEGKDVEMADTAEGAKEATSATAVTEAER